MNCISVINIIMCYYVKCKEMLFGALGVRGFRGPRAYIYIYIYIYICIHNTPSQKKGAKNLRCYPAKVSLS